jgi:CRP-like cAMP-binding protein
LPVGDIVSSSRATRGSVTPRHRLSQDELANGLGVARKGVMRAFADWIDAGVLTKRGA